MSSQRTVYGPQAITVLSIVVALVLVLSGVYIVFQLFTYNGGPRAYRMLSVLVWAERFIGLAHDALSSV